MAHWLQTKNESLLQHNFRVASCLIYKNRIFISWIGNASTSSFSVVCLDWRDEGIYAERSDTRDPTLNEPLVYEYVAYIPETDGLTKYYQSAVPIFRGSEYLIMLTY